MRKILIGAPIHECKEYGIYEYIDAVSKLDYDNFLLYLVDNTATPDFAQRVRDYCQKIGFIKVEVVHLEGMIDSDGYEKERLGFSRDKIRERFLNDRFTPGFLWSVTLLSHQVC